MIEGTWRKKVIAGTVAAAALVGGGGAIAASQLGPDADEQAILNDAAERLGVEPSELSDALEQAYAARIDAAVAAGELTKEQGDALKERLAAGDLPLVGGPFLGHGHGFHGHHHLFGGLDSAASYLGLTEGELREQLEGGKTLAEIATAEGKSVDGLEQALLDEAKTALDAAVADGRLTEAQAQEILADLPERIDDLVNGELQGKVGPGFGEQHHQGGFMPDDSQSTPDI
jgi:hypothetical protein